MSFISIIKSIDRKERKLIIFISLAVIIITILPVIFGYLKTPDGSVYTGIHALTPGDFNVYYSYIEQVKQGDFLFQDLYTSERQKYPLIKPFWLLIGLFARIFKLTGWLAVQISRLILIPIFIFTAYLFISYLFSEKVKRKIAILFLVFSSGLGGLLAPVLERGKYIMGGYYHWPMDLWVPEAISFLSLYHLPHIIASSILFLLVFLFLLLAFENNRYRYSLISGVILSFWVWFHPFHIFTVFSVLVVFIFAVSLRRKKILVNYLKHFSVVILIALPAIIYQVEILRIDSLTAGRAVQNILITPVPWLLLVSYGFLGILALIGCFLLLKENREKYFFIAIWFIVQVFLLYAPLAFQRRLSQNLHFPITILAVAALFFLYQLLLQKKSKWFFNHILNNKTLHWFLFLILFAFSNIYVVAKDFLLYQKQVFYLPSDYYQSLIWIKNNAKKDEIVLSEWIDGNFIPGFSGKKVYIGHDVETVKYEYKKKKVIWFFKDNGEDSKKLKFLQENNIKYIFYSENEKNIGRFSPQSKKYLQEVFNNQEVTIYSMDI